MSADAGTYLQFDQLFREHYNALANYAFSILRNKQDAEDVVQDVFIKMWQKNPTVITTREVKFYLLTATKNTCISLLRKQAGLVTIDVETADLPAATVAEEPRDLTAIINQALALLPPQCLIIFKMSRFGHLTYRQIAHELGISVKTVESQMGKALRIMRDYAKQQNIPYSLLLLVLCPGWFQ